VTTHHLLIEPLLDVDPRFARFLTQLDVVRNERFNLRFKITNVGKTFFPGGYLHKITMREVQTTGTFLLSKEEIDISPIPAGASHNSSVLGLTSLTWEGGVMVSLRVKTRGFGDKVRYYQQQNAKPIPGRQWVNFFHSVNREVMLSIELMDRLVRQLEKQEPNSSSPVS
jgi:hypothetical protein